MNKQEMVEGRKVFFVYPDRSLFPEEYLADLLAYGFECYFVNHLKQVSLDKQIINIIENFKDAIIFFNVDYSIEGFNWNEYILKLVNIYPEIFVGVLYSKRQTSDEKMRIVKYYLNLPTRCGCIELDFKKKNNFSIIHDCLEYNEARGRRKAIRIVCNTACTFNTVINGEKYSGYLTDISLSHCSIFVNNAEPNIKIYEKLPQVSFNVKGFMFRSDITLMIERKTDEGTLFVFAFNKKNGEYGLDDGNYNLILPKLYELLLTNMQILNYFNNNL